MHYHDFNIMCAKHLQIFKSENDRGVVVRFEGEEMQHVFDPYYDANHRNMVISDLGISTVLLSNMESPEWQATYRLQYQGAPCITDIEIETGESIEEAQNKCIVAALSEL